MTLIHNLGGQYTQLCFSLGQLLTLTPFLPDLNLTPAGLLSPHSHHRIWQQFWRLEFRDELVEAAWPGILFPSGPLVVESWQDCLWRAHLQAACDHMSPVGPGFSQTRHAERRKVQPLLSILSLPNLPPNQGESRLCQLLFLHAVSRSRCISP